MSILKPLFGRLWASGADPANVVDPDLKYLAGWEAGEIPPAEYFNFITQDITNKLNYLNQQGIPEWDATTEYISNSIVSYGGRLYRSVNSYNLNNTPIPISTGGYGAFWKYPETLDISDKTITVITPEPTSVVMARLANECLKVPTFSILRTSYPLVSDISGDRFEIPGISLTLPAGEYELDAKVYYKNPWPNSDGKFQAIYLTRNKSSVFNGIVTSSEFEPTDGAPTTLTPSETKLSYNATFANQYVLKRREEATMSVDFSGILRLESSTLVNFKIQNTDLDDVGAPTTTLTIYPDSYIKVSKISESLPFAGFPYTTTPTPPVTLGWKPLPSGLGVIPPSIYDTYPGFTTLLSDGKGVWIGGMSYGYIVRSEDNGYTWTELPRNLGTGADDREITALDTDFNGVWIAGLDDGYAARSTDNGKTWTPLVQGLNSGGVFPGSYPALHSIATDRLGVWVAAFENGWASRSTDNGITWAALVRGLNCGVASSTLKSIATDGSGVWVVVCYSGYAARSTNNGVTWSTLTRGLNNGSPTRYAQSVDTDRLGVWVVGFDQGYASRSIDNGATWSGLTRGLNSGAASSSDYIYEVKTNRAGVWLASFQGGWIARSSDNGATWEAGLKGVNSGALFGTDMPIGFGADNVWVMGVVPGYQSINNNNGET